MAEKLVLTHSDEATSAIFGAFDSNVRMIERAFDVRISNKSGGADMGDAIIVTGERDAVELAARTLEYLKRMSGEGETLSEQSVEYVIGLISENPAEPPENYSGDVICVTNRGKPIKAKTVGQQNYMKAIGQNTITLGVGPAGTGKTYQLANRFIALLAIGVPATQMIALTFTKKAAGEFRNRIFQQLCLLFRE